MRNDRFEKFMAQLESAVTEDSEKNVVKKALEGYKALAEASTIYDKNFANSGRAPTLNQFATHKEIQNAPGNKTFAKEASANAPSQADLNIASKNIISWAKAEPEKAARWVKRLQSLIDNTAMQKYSYADDPKKAFDDAVSGKTAEDVKKLDDELKAKQDAEAEQKAKDDEKKAAAEKNKAEHAERYYELKAQQDKNEKDNAMNDATYGQGTVQKKKLSLKDRLAMKWNKWRAGIKEAIERGDIAMLESIEAEMRSAKAFMESLGYDVSSVMY